MKYKLLTIRHKFNNLSDRELVNLIVDKNNDDAVIYLLYERYYKRIKAWVYECYKSMQYLDEMINCLYIHLKGKKADWHTLSTFKKDEAFLGWLKRVSINLFLEKRNEMIGLGISKSSDVNVTRVGDDPIPEPRSDNKISDCEHMVMAMEAISRLKNDDYRFVIIKELEKYNHEEIAMLLREKDKANNVTRRYRGQITLPTASYIDMIKGRAINELKIIIVQIKKEWYDSK